MNNKKTLSTVLGLLAMSTNAAVHADCAQLETALKAAPSQMASLKQGLYHKDDPEVFNTSWRWDAATADDCMVSYDSDNGYDITCTMRATGMDSAVSNAKSIAATVDSCLKTSGRKYASEGWRDHSSKYGTGGRHTFVVQHSDQNDIEVDAAGSCRTSKKGIERCSYSITVQLLGDERE